MRVIKRKAVVVKAILLTVVGQVIGVGRDDVQEESRLCIWQATWIFDVGNAVFPAIYVKVGAQDRSSGHN